MNGDPVQPYDVSDPTERRQHPAAPAVRPLTRPPAGPTLTALFMLIGAGLIVGVIIYHAVGWQVGRELNKRGRLDYCPNDASRWNTVFFLVEKGSYQYSKEWNLWWQGKEPKPPWDMGPFWSIDVVARKAKNDYEYYSSKPPLYPTLMAGFVLATQYVSAWLEPAVRSVLEPLVAESRRANFPYKVSFRETPFFMVPFTLIVFQVIPFMFFVWVIARQFHEMSGSAYVRDFCVATAALATYLTPWCITLNNHVLGGFFALFALHAAIRIWYDGRREWYWFAMAGFFSAFAHTFELPALALTAAVIAGATIKDWRRGLLVALPFALLPLAAEVVTNYYANGTWNIAYSGMGVYGPVKGGAYDYPGSHWLNAGGIDALKEPYRIYVFHLLFGHHGFFLLTPILLVGLLGAGRHLRGQGGVAKAALGTFILAGLAFLVVYDVQRDEQITDVVQIAVNWLLAGYAVNVHGGYALLAPLIVFFLINLGMYMRPAANPRPLLALLAISISVLVVVFYTFFAMRNYGGGAQGPRWLFWLIPLWLLMLPAGLERLAPRRMGRLFCYTALFVSVLSTGFVYRQPWGASWAHQFFNWIGWIDY